MLNKTTASSTGTQKEWKKETKKLTYYTECDCDTRENWNKNWLTSCDKYSGTSDPNLYCTSSNSSYKQSCFLLTSAGLVKLDEKQSCKSSDGTVKYKACRCRTLGDSDQRDVTQTENGTKKGCLTVAKACKGKTSCTVDPSRGNDDGHCFQNGKYVVSLNGEVIDTENCWTEF